jgi:hypothetical protein
VRPSDPGPALFGAVGEDALLLGHSHLLPQTVGQEVVPGSL